MEEIITQRRNKGATVRAILIGLALVAFNAYWVTITEMKYRAEATALPIYLFNHFLPSELRPPEPPAAWSQRMLLGPDLSGFLNPDLVSG